MIAYGSKLNIVKILIQKHKIDINHKNNNGWAALILSSEKGDLEIVKLLVEKDANINTEDKYGLMPLVIATACGSVEVVKLLIEIGFNINQKI